MSPFEYALALLSVLIGLALADIAQKAHRLIRHARTIVWDGRVIVSTLLVIITVVDMWFSVWSIRERADILAYGFYLTLFLEMMLLFVVAASSLPDDAGPDCNLRAFYDGGSRTFWLCFAAFQLSFFGHWLYFTQLQGAWQRMMILLLFVACFLLLAFLRNKVLHYLIPTALLAVLLLTHWQLTFN